MTKIDLINFKPDENSFDSALPQESNNAFFYYEKIRQLENHISQQIKENEYLQAEIAINDNSRITVESFGYFDTNMITVLGINENNESTVLLLPHVNIQIIFTVKEKEKDKEYNRIGFLI